MNGNLRTQIVVVIAPSQEHFYRRLEMTVSLRYAHPGSVGRRRLQFRLWMRLPGFPAVRDGSRVGIWDGSFRGAFQWHFPYLGTAILLRTRDGSFVGVLRMA
jgi:hypothetical protein